MKTSFVVRGVATLVVSVVFGAGPALAATTLADRLGSGFEKIARQFSQSIGRSLPLVAASAGVQFAYDPETGAYERTASTVGQLFVERAQPIGAGHWNASLGYQHVSFDSFEGHDLGHLSDRRPVVAPDGVPLFTLPDTRISIEANEVTASVTYGVTDALDVNLAVPVVDTEFDRYDRVVGWFPGAPPPQSQKVGASKVGIGDLFLRGKYLLWHGDQLDVAAGLALRLPTADAGNFHGSGTFGANPMLIVSTARWTPHPGIELQGHANAGMDFDAADVSQSEGRWAMGLDVGLGTRVRLALALLGRHAVDRLAAPGTFDEPRCLEPVAVCQRDPLGSHKGPLPLFGFRGERADYVDLSIGGRVHLWRDTIMGFANVIVPLTGQGLRTDPIPLAGVEVAF